MDYQSFPPSKKCSPFIKNYFWVRIDARNEVFRRKMFPTGTSHLTFFLEGNNNIYVNDTTIEIAGVMLGGQFLKHFELSSSGMTAFFGIAFQPTAINKLFDIDVQGLSNMHVPFTKYIGAAATRLFNDVKRHQRVEERIAILEDFLWKYAASPIAIPGIIDECVSAIQLSAGCIQIDTLMEKYKVSRRYLEKHFTRIVGVSPGKYAKLIRFLHVLKEIEDKESRAEDLIAQYNYYDHSHFTKDFELYMGEKPIVYYQNRNTLIAEVFSKRSIP